jgi:ribosomal protein L12E/L44/L45/RPP1/RPP2
MRGRLSIFVFVVLVVALLVALNAASYVRVEREPELEANPDRSASNAGPTGTRAIYEYLEESGRKVMRWREPTEALLKPGGAQPSTFVVVGALRREFTDEEKKDLTRWVARGGRLVVVDRLPEQLLSGGERWGVASSMNAAPAANVRADDMERLLAGAQTLAPTQPTLLASSVERIAPSRFAGRLRAISKTDMGEVISKNAATKATPAPAPTPAPPRAATPHGNANRDNANNNANDDETETDEEEEPPPPLTPTPTPRATPSHTPVVVPYPDSRRGIGSANAHPEDRAAPDAPVLNFADERGALLADFARGRGRIIVLSDPFIVANNGITRADNLQLAVNVLTSGGGLIAFDEYHQGRGETHNQLITYFAGTPVIAMFAQVVLIVAIVVWSRGRRFARPLPAPLPDRRSKLEFVASMAELQQRARAFDLALENIYSRTRRALARYGGTDLAAPRAAVAAAVAARSGTDRARLEELMRECEDAAAGEPITARRALALAAQLRELERTLGIRMRAREIKQAGRR